MQQYDRKFASLENAYNAYINRDSKTKAIKRENDRGVSPEIVDVVIPHIWSTVQTISHYMLHTFGGAESAFTIKGFSRQDDITAKLLEKVIQLELNETNYIPKFQQFTLDAYKYGFGVVKLEWKTKREKDFSSSPPTSTPYFEYTDLENIDPYRFYPDPRVPVGRQARDGEFVFFTSKDQRFALREAEAQGLLKWTNKIPERSNRTDSERDMSARYRRNYQLNTDDSEQVEQVDSLNQLVEIIQGTIRLDPEQLKKWGKVPEGALARMYKVTIANSQTLIQLEPYDTIHDKHPIIVAEPLTNGYDFISPGIVEIIQDYQSLESWLYNSRIANVRYTINGTPIVNPNYVETKDIANRTPGSAIRLKQGALGNKISEVIQFAFAPDVTAAHIRDMQVTSDIADQASGISGIVRGEDANIEQTATEVNTKMNNATSRLAAQARLISSQAFVPLAEMMIANRKQFTSIPVFVGNRDLTAKDFQGHFRFIAHDGTLPQARQQEVNFFREIFPVIRDTPELAKKFDIVGMTEQYARLSNVDLTAYERSEEDIAKIEQEIAAQPSEEELQRRHEVAIKDVEYRSALEIEKVKAQTAVLIEQIRADAGLTEKREENTSKELQTSEKVAGDLTKEGIKATAPKPSTL